MFKLKQYMPRKALQALCYSLTDSHLFYGLPVWDSTHPSYLKKTDYIAKQSSKTDRWWPL